MSAILKKRVLFLPKYSHFLPKGVYFLHVEQTPPHFVEKGSLLSAQKSSPLCESQCFVEKGSYLSLQKSAFLRKRGLFFTKKVSGKGYLLILENDHTSPLLQTSGGTGCFAHSEGHSEPLLVRSRNWWVGEMVTT